MSEIMIKQIIMYISVPFLFVALITPGIKRIAKHVHALDMPNERKVHKVPIARLGGLGIFMGFLLGLILFGNKNSMISSIAIGGFIILLTGIIDDINPLKPKYKFIGQLLAASVVVIYGELNFEFLSAFGMYLKFGFWAYPLAIGLIIGCINCINLIDGLDGLCSGISAIYFITIGIICIITDRIGFGMTLAFIMLGSCLGFLVHNFHPASIFMGDSGSMFLGYIIGVIAIMGFKNVTITSLIIPILILAIPIIDTLFALLRRKIKGQPMMKPDKLHIHHQLLNQHLTQVQAVLLLYLIDILFAAASIFNMLNNVTIGYILYIILAIIVILFILKTSIVFEHKSKNK